MSLFLAVLSLLLVPTINSAATGSRDSRIIGGGLAEISQFPFVAAISVQTPTSRFFCGGTLLTSNHVLTAGHCVDGAQLFLIKLGTHLLNWTDDWTYQNSTSAYILHPEFNATTLENDLGVIPFTPSTMHPDHLFYVDSLKLRPVWPDEQVIAMGWGQVKGDTNYPVNALHYALMTTISNEECKITYGDQIKGEMLCAVGNTNQGTCWGDSGSPLIQELFGEQVLVGVAIFVSVNGCTGLEPSGFVRIYSHWSWLYHVTGRLT